MSDQTIPQDTPEAASPVEAPILLTLEQAQALARDAAREAIAAYAAAHPTAAPAPAPGLTAEQREEQKARITASEAAKPGDVVLHNGRPVLVYAVSTRPRATKSGKTWDQVLYHVAEFRGHQVLEAEDTARP